MLNCYLVKVKVTGHYTKESPSCPASWRGSGCYDVDIKTWSNAQVEVWAESEDAAKQFAAGSEFKPRDCAVDVDNVQIVGVEFVSPLPDRDADEESGVIDICGLDKWEENEDYAEDNRVEFEWERYLEKKYGS